MLFPESPRVVYRKNPLDQVICQVQFPQILRINTETPVAFQEKIRDRFPVVETQNNIELPISGELIEALPIPLGESLTRSRQHFDFKSRDSNWIVSLESGFIALTALKYSRWEEFRDNLTPILDAFQVVYGTSFYTRVGLRYVDVIRKSRLEIDTDTAWNELIAPHIAGVFSIEGLTDAIEDTMSMFAVKLDEINKRVRVQHGLVRDNSTGELCYLIDSDFHTPESQQVEVNDVISTLNQLNQQGRRLFRWCITEKLHEILEPESIS